MNSTPFDLILGQSYLHLVSYGLVGAILFRAIADAYLISHLKRALRSEGTKLREGGLAQSDLAGMVHPAASTLGKLGHSVSRIGRSTLERQVDLAEATLFVPLRARMALTRDLSTLMGLIATLLALVAAATDFARHGKPELLVGSVGTGCVATCIAAVGCAVALWNLSRLMRLRVTVASENEEVLLGAGDLEGPAADPVPILLRPLADLELVNSQPEQNHDPL